MRSSRAGAGGRKRAASNGGQRVFSVNTPFWKILVTRVKRKMREGKILIPLRELAAANSSNQHRGPPEHEDVDSHWRGAARDGKSAFTRVCDALCVAAATVRTCMTVGRAQYAIAATSEPWSMRSFAEYAFLEDSRYASQAKNARGK